MDNSAARTAVIDALLSKQFSQRNLMSPEQFRITLGERGISLRIDDLESWNRNGAIHPIMIARTPFSLHRITGRWPNGEPNNYDPQPLPASTPETKDISRVYDTSFSWELLRQRREELVNTPSAETFQPWKEFQEQNVILARPFYHPQQVFRVRQALNNCRHCIYFPDFTVSNMDVWETSVRKRLASRVSDLQHSEINYLLELRLILLIEDAYFPEIRQSITLDGLADVHEWYRWRNTFDPSAALAQSGFTIAQLTTLRLRLAREGSIIDPNQKLFQLIRHVPHSQREQLKGDALLALDYYDSAEMLSRFLEDLTGEHQPNLDDLTNMNGGRWKKDIFGVDPELFDYDRGHALPSVLRHFGLDPRIRVLLVVEGQSEDAFIKTWFKLQELDLREHGISIIPVRGTSGLKNEAIKLQVRAAIEDGACIIVTIDQENDAADTIQTWIADGLVERTIQLEDLDDQEQHPIGAMLWTPCFEDANFTREELLAAWVATMAGRHNVPSITELSQRIESAVRIDPAKTLIKVIESLADRRGLPSLRKPELASQLASRFADSDKPITKLLRRILLLAKRTRRARYERKNTGADASSASKPSTRTPSKEP